METHEDVVIVPNKLYCSTLFIYSVCRRLFLLRSDLEILDLSPVSIVVIITFNIISGGGREQK